MVPVLTFSCPFLKLHQLRRYERLTNSTTSGYVALIACLGWSLLCWDPGELPVVLPWRLDSPPVPVEFLRQSKNGRITLVLNAATTPVTSCWAPMDVSLLAAAISAPADPERPTPLHNIGRWSTAESDPPLLAGLAEWAAAHGVERVVWTALGPKFAGQQCPGPRCGA